MFGLEKSVNSRARTDDMLPCCMYGACLRRLINWACAARAKYLNTPIFASKVDFKSAYRRCHLNPSTALQSCTQVETNEEDKLLIMFLPIDVWGQTLSERVECTSRTHLRPKHIYTPRRTMGSNNAGFTITIAGPTTSTEPRLI